MFLYILKIKPDIMISKMVLIELKIFYDLHLLLYFFMFLNFDLIRIGSSL
jgi:hypothetical protein